MNYRSISYFLFLTTSLFISCNKESDEVEVVAIFSSSARETGTGETVQFTDRSSGDPTSWSWTFEGGTPATSTDQNPVVTYATEGVYDVTLTVTNNFSENTLNKNDFITIKKIIYPDFSVEETTISEGESIQFTDATVGDPTTWSWRFEGGTPATSTMQHPEVTYDQAGVYSVELTVSNGSTTGSLTETRIIHVTCTGTYCEQTFSGYTTQEVIYGNNADGHRMILYMPEGDSRTDRPVIALMGGGSGFNGTNLNYLDPVAINLVKYGSVVALLRYRVINTNNPEEKMISAQQDCRTAIRFLKSEAENLRINPDHIFIGGNGNGAFAALFPAYIDEDELPADDLNRIDSYGGLEGEAQGHSEYSSEVAGVVSLAGGMYGSLNFITAEDVPIYAIHGTEDPDVDPGYTPSNPPLYGSIRIVEKVQSVGLSARLYLIQGGVHETPRLQSDKWSQDFMYFVREVIAP